MSAVRTRFAPSPTGALHIGGARTALFNHLFARHHGGTFILRIEDTDLERSKPEFVEEIVASLGWLGIDWDEGPIFQTQRTALYRDAIDRLLESGDAYPCTCSPEELEARREEARKNKGRLGYDGHCRPGVGPGPVTGRPSTVRFAMPESGRSVIDDAVKGEVSFDNAEIDDFVIARSDGSPTYHLVVTVDDVEMAISHVIRGDDHLSNTFKQAAIYRALGADLPTFAHIPLVLGEDGARLSKRHAATAVTAYRDMGYLPEAVVNFIARLGWSHGDQEIFHKTELVQAFTLGDVGRSAGVFNLEKLRWMNFQYMKELSPEDLARALQAHREAQGKDVPGDLAWLGRAVQTLQERAHTLVELDEMAEFYIADSIEIEPKAAKKALKPEAAATLDEVASRLAGVATWTAEELEKVVRAMAEDLGIKLGAIAQPVRVAVTGRTASPGIFETLDVLGQEKCLKRLKIGADRARSGTPEP